MAKKKPVAGLPTLIKQIQNNPDLTRLEKQSLIEDAKIMAKDGKLSKNEKDFLRSEIDVFGSPNNGAVAVPITPTITSPAPTPVPNISNPSPPNQTNTSVSTVTATSTPIPSPTPPVADSPKIDSTTTAIKQATPDIIVFDEEIDPNFLTEAFFEEFGGTELINISRHDLINGDQVSYSPILNLNLIKQSFNSNNVIAIQSFQENETKYKIDLISRGVNPPYLDKDGNLIIEIDEVREDESIEVEISTSGTINVIEL